MSASHQPGAGRKNIATLLNQLDESVAQFLSIMRALPHPERGIDGEWSARDVLGHITFWHESFARNTADLARGIKPTPLKGRLGDLNLQGVEEMRQRPLDEVLQRLEDAQRVIHAHILHPGLTSIPYRRGSRDYSPEEHLEVVNGHIQQHLKSIRKADQNGTLL